MKSIKSITKYQRLPAEFQEVEYIESSGTQYIDTGIVPNTNTRIDAKVLITQHTAADSYDSLFGVIERTTDNVQTFDCQLAPTNYIYFSSGVWGVDNISVVSEINTEYNISFSVNGQITINGNSYSLTSGWDNTTSLTLSIFALHYFYDYFYNNYSHMRLYSFVIYDGNTIVRKFIPCYRISDNVIGLYDLSNGVFYTNAGTGTFAKGADVKFIESIETNIKGIGSPSVLPAEYQEVEYIQSSGDQYIDTGVKLSSSDTIKCKFELTGPPTSSSEGVFGTMEYRTGDNTFFVLLMRTPNLARVGTSSNQVTSTNVATNTVYDTSLSNGTYIENGTTYTFTPHNGFTFNTSCYVFKRNQASMTPIKGKIYSFEIVGKFKGIPCYRKADNVIGMYDTVSETFFTNAGTGDFIKGADVNNVIRLKTIAERINTTSLPNAYQEVEYIESSGTQYIDTAIKLENNSYCNIDFKYSELQYQMMGGNTETTQRYFIGIKSTLDLFYFGIGDTNNYYGTADTNRHSFIIDMPNSKVAVDDNYSDVSFTFTNNDSSHNFYLFARINSSGEIVNNCAGRLYKGLFKHNNNIIRNFIPCYRKADGEIGLYDLVNGGFYTNSGTGTFLKGKNIY